MGRHHSGRTRRLLGVGVHSPPSRPSADLLAAAQMLLTLVEFIDGTTADPVPFLTLESLDETMGDALPYLIGLPPGLWSEATWAIAEWLDGLTVN